MAAHRLSPEPAHSTRKVTFFARREAFGPDTHRGSKRCCKNLERSMVLSHPVAPTAKSHSFLSNHKTTSHFAWLQPGCMPLPKGVPPAPGEQSCLIPFLVPPATKILLGTIKSRPQLSQQHFHILINKTNRISNRSKEHLYC